MICFIGEGNNTVGYHEKKKFQINETKKIFIGSLIVTRQYPHLYTPVVRYSRTQKFFSC